jgi:uncharacterized protein YukE
MDGTAVNLKVTPERLIEKSSQTSASIRTMTNQFEQLKKLVAKTQAYWLGDGGDVHRNLYTDMEADVEYMLKRLAEHPTDLIEIAQKYSTVETQIQQEIQELPGDVIV